MSVWYVPGFAGRIWGPFTAGANVEVGVDVDADVGADVDAVVDVGVENVAVDAGVILSTSGLVSSFASPPSTSAGLSSPQASRGLLPPRRPLSSSSSPAPLPDFPPAVFCSPPLASSVGIVVFAVCGAALCGVLDLVL